MTKSKSTPMTVQSDRRRSPAQVGLAGLALVMIAALSSTRCDNARCEELRESLYREKLDWQACENPSDCMIIGGNGGDCTGVLSCNIAVNRESRLRAERRIASLPELTVDCHECGSPNCPEGEIPYCEPRTGLCVIVSGFLDAGSPGALESIGGELVPVPRPKDDAAVDVAVPGYDAAAREPDAATAPVFPF